MLHDKYLDLLGKLRYSVGLVLVFRRKQLFLQLHRLEDNKAEDGSSLQLNQNNKQKQHMNHLNRSRSHTSLTGPKIVIN